MLAAVVVIAYAGFALARTVPRARVAGTQSVRPYPGDRTPLAWPGHGEAALAVSGLGLIGASGSDRPTPIASVTKVMTAYLVLTDHPLVGDAQGPTLTVTAADAAAERGDAAAGQSVLPVRAGERLTERRALEGLLLPSGNNAAVMLARWDAGSERAFVARMNATARALGLLHTHYTGASGFAPSTVSTATDQVRLAETAFRLPVFRQIVGLAVVTLPVAGRQYNVDALVGSDGILGIKTGTTSEAGGCFVFAARVRAGGRFVTAFGAILDQSPGGSTSGMLAAVFAATKSLLASGRRVVGDRPVVARGSTLATVTTPWSGPIALRATRSVHALGWTGLSVVTVVPDRRLPGSVPAGQVVATATVTVGPHRFAVPLAAAVPIDGPSAGWRLTHP